jgi:hypothetical protein
MDEFPVDPANDDMIQFVRDELAKYRAYSEYLVTDDEILSASLQCLANGSCKDVNSLQAVFSVAGV